MQLGRRQLMIVAILVSLVTGSIAQQVDRVLEWSNQFETIRAKMRRVAETIDEKCIAFSGTDQIMIGQFAEEIGELSAALGDLQVEADKVRTAIEESSNELDRTLYQRAMRDYAQTMREYSAAMRHYSVAMKKYAQAMRDQSERTAGPRDAPERAVERAVEQMHERIGHPKKPPEPGGPKERRKTWREEQEERETKLKQELSQIGTVLKPGDEVVVLRDTQLKAGSETFGSVAKGQKVVVEQIQGKWAWVKRGQVRGWVDKEAVIGATIMDWYGRLQEGASVENEGQARAKFRGVLFEMDGAGSKGGTINFNVNYAEPCTAAFYTKMMVFLEKRVDGLWGLYLNYNHRGTLSGSPPFPAAFKGHFYGTAAEGDYVRISAHARQVFVNGQLRAAK